VPTRRRPRRASPQSSHHCRQSRDRTMLLPSPSPREDRRGATRSSEQTPGRWVLALILPLQDRLRPSDGALFRANVATPLLDGEVHATLTPLQLNRIR